MTIKEMCRDDLINRYASHTFTETIVNDMVKVEFKDASGNVIQMAQKIEITDAYRAIRNSVDEYSGNDYCLTTAEQGALTDVQIATRMWNITDDKLQIYDGVDWDDMS